jgi:hypothetical protein
VLVPRGETDTVEVVTARRARLKPGSNEGPRKRTARHVGGLECSLTLRSGHTRRAATASSTGQQPLRLQDVLLCKKARLLRAAATCSVAQMRATARAVLLDKAPFRPYRH